MSDIKLIKHAPGAPGLRLFGLGPNLMPKRGVTKLEQLFNKSAFWASGRKSWQLRRMLKSSSVVVSAWNSSGLVGFGRATSDGIYRAVLWDVVVQNDHQSLGVGGKIVESLLDSKSIKAVERIYLMTTNCEDFYRSIGFDYVNKQKLFLLRNHASVNCR